MDEVILITTDNRPYTVLERVARMSGTLKNIMEDRADFSEGIPLPSVDGPTLERVITWANYHVDDVVTEPVVKSETETKIKLELSDKPPVIPEWDAQFCASMDQDALFKVILAANYLEMRPLLDLCCRTVAMSLIGKTPDEVYAVFKVDKKLTDEEKAELLAENPWLQDQ